MPRQKNDGKGRMGGRPKGAPNKVTATLKEWIAKLIDDNRERIAQDLDCIEPAERLKILSSLLNYCVPKQQSVTIEESMTEEYKHLEQLLQTAPDEAIEKIAEKVKQMENYHNERKR